MICPPCANTDHGACADAGRILEGRRAALISLRAEFEASAPDISRIVDSIDRVLGQPTTQETQP